MASKKGKAAKNKSKGKKGGGRKGGWFGSFGGNLLFELGAVMVLGSVLLAKLCKLPAWLSPIGASLWLFGWWRNIPIARSLGLLMIGTGFVQLLGLPAAFSKTIDNAKAKGILGGIFSGFGGGQTGEVDPTSSSGGSELENVVSVAADLTNDLSQIAGGIAGIRTAMA